MWAGVGGRTYTESHFQVVLNALTTTCFREPYTVGHAASPPPPPPDYRNCKAKPCGPGTCFDFLHSPCSLVTTLHGGSCDCTGCCTPDGDLRPPPPSPPPPSPGHPAPAPAACSIPCAGSTCGAFAPYSCTAFESIGCDCSGCCSSPANLQCVTSVWPPDNMANLYAFTEGTSGRRIKDGGHDMFDGGNYLAVSVSKCTPSAAWGRLCVRWSLAGALQGFSRATCAHLPPTLHHLAWHPLTLHPPPV